MYFLQAMASEAKISPMFAAYSGGKLVKTWHGANNKRFVTNMEVLGPTQQGMESGVPMDGVMARVFHRFNDLMWTSHDLLISRSVA